MSWLCPHQLGELCRKVNPVRNVISNGVKKICEPGMKGCVLRGRAKFVEFEKEVSERKAKSAEGLGSRYKKSIGSPKR